MFTLRSVPQNTQGTDYIVGDIHGCFEELKNALAEIGFNSRYDRLFATGDLVDRGPDSVAALTWLTLPWFYSVMGNHDEYAVRYPNGGMDEGIYRRNGGQWNLERSAAEQREVGEVLNQLPLALEIQTPTGLVGLVHAECPMADWAQFKELLTASHLKRSTVKNLTARTLWARTRIENQDRTPIQGLRALVVGHTPHGIPRWLGNVFYADTGAGKDGRITVFKLNDLETYGYHYL